MLRFVTIFIILIFHLNCFARINLITPVSKNENSFSYQVKLDIPSEDIDWSVSTLTRNGTPIDFPAFENRVATVSEKDLLPGKYSYYFKIYNRAKELAGELFVPVWIGDNFQWDDSIMYQIMVDRFVNGDYSNDSPTPDVMHKNNWQGGDFKGIINKIKNGHFKRMGVNTLSISSPIINTSSSGLGIADDYLYSAYHSYWPIALGWTDDSPQAGIITPIEPRFGTRAELKELVNLAHQDGIRVMFDFVANHLHQDAPVYSRLPQHWINNLFVCGWNQPLRCWFTDYLPDLNYDHQEVIDFSVNHALWMIKEFNVDGFRVDAVKHMNIGIVTTLRRKIQEQIESSGVPFYMVGETFTGDCQFDLIGTYIAHDKLNGQFDFPLFYNISRTFLISTQGFVQLYYFYKENENRYQNNYHSKALMSNFLGNHDIARAASVANNDFGYENGELGGDVAKYRTWYNPPLVSSEHHTYQKMKLAWTFLMTIRGIPLIYQGDEIAMPGAGDPDNRRMMFFDNDLTTLQKDLKEYVSKLAHFRNSHPALRYGEIQELWINDNIFVYSMKHDDDYVLVAMNRNDHPVSLTATLYNKPSISSMVEYFSSTEHRVNNSKIEINIEPHSAMIFTESDNSKE